jgi:hypothetical protein
MKGFGCKVFAYGPIKIRRWIGWELTPENQHMINVATLAQMKKGVTPINTCRGGLINTTDAVSALKSVTMSKYPSRLKNWSVV